MSVNAKHVFLVSGQRLVTVEGGSEKLSPDIEQCVVVANDDQEAYKALLSMEPNFRPLGCATLDDYESTAIKLRAVLKGDGNTGWKLIVAESVAV